MLAPEADRIIDCPEQIVVLEGDIVTFGKEKTEILTVLELIQPNVFVPEIV